MKYEVIDTRTGEVVTLISLQAEALANQCDRDHWLFTAGRLEILALYPDGQLFVVDHHDCYYYTPPHIQARAITEAESE